MKKIFKKLSELSPEERQKLRQESEKEPLDLSEEELRAELGQEADVSELEFRKHLENIKRREIKNPVLRWLIDLVELILKFIFLIIFLFIPPIALIWVIWAVTGEEPDTYGKILMATFTILYWWMLFGTKPGKKIIDFISNLYN